MEGGRSCPCIHFGSDARRPTKFRSRMEGAPVADGGVSMPEPPRLLLGQRSE